MERLSLADLIAALEETLAAIINAMRTFFSPLRSGPPAKPPKTSLTQFGEYEKAEESKYYPPWPPHALKLEQGELPDSYGHTRLVMLVVDPYLVHAYWEVTPDKLAEARKEIRGDSARAVLRFYEVAVGAAVNDHPAGWFDVDVDLQPRYWYVHLWRADKVYYADLGLKSDDGQLVPLARSNLIRTPRAWPVVKVEEDFMRVEPTQQLAEFVPPPPGLKGHRAQPAALPARAPAVGVPVGDLAATAGVQAGAPPAGGFSRPVDSAETLREKLADLYTLRGWCPEPLKAGERPVRAAPGTCVEEPRADLTEMAEQKFVSGVSSPMAQRKRAED